MEGIKTLPSVKIKSDDQKWSSFSQQGETKHWQGIN